MRGTILVVHRVGKFHESPAGEELIALVDVTKVANILVGTIGRIVHEECAVVANYFRNGVVVTKIFAILPARCLFGFDIQRFFRHRWDKELYELLACTNTFPVFGDTH